MDETSECDVIGGQGDLWELSKRKEGSDLPC